MFNSLALSTSSSALPDHLFQALLHKFVLKGSCGHTGQFSAGNFIDIAGIIWVLIDLLRAGGHHLAAPQGVLC